MGQTSVSTEIYSVNKLFCPIGIKIRILLLIFNMLQKIISKKRNNLIRKRIIITCGG